ncbi:hypothetical protein PB1_11239 [Bacillus methanolicus PB1]|uniref:Uncharacterized protein n=1 Tax=Bacillus methanolicus PB1 TaxID=997296 RepID=I3DV59_BACMT|nr:hypothetical protein [Bacillus methanolicus]EIJ78130.1 hypothetical protein PB1_11239 [Bacillus methanolicus PB1]
MSEQNKIQVNVRLSKVTVEKLDEIVAYYQENTKIGKVYKGDVLTDIIEKSYEIMKKQKSAQKMFQKKY